MMSYGAKPGRSVSTRRHVRGQDLKGVNPADLPVEQPTKLELVFSLKTARDLGLVVSREFLSLADELIGVSGTMPSIARERPAPQAWWAAVPGARRSPGASTAGRRVTVWSRGPAISAAIARDRQS